MTLKELPQKSNSFVERRGLMLILSSPSGAGKSSLARALVAEDQNLMLSVSATTRPIRPGEEDGKDYHFKTPSEFSLMVEQGKLLEWAQVFENKYGTPKAQIEEGLLAGVDYMFDLDWQGTQQIAQQARDDMVSVFILPPSTTELHQRLVKRGQDDAKVVARRMAGAHDELSHWAEYDYVIVNKIFEHSLTNLRAILAAERLKRTRQPGLSAFVRQLRQELTK